VGPIDAANANVVAIISTLTMHLLTVQRITVSIAPTDEELRSVMTPNKADHQQSEPADLTARQLAELTGTTVRTIHYYASEGLLPGPTGATRAASYTPAHRARLRLIGALREEGLSLAGIRARLAPLSDQQALDVIEAYDRHLAAGDRGPFSPLGLIDAAVKTQLEHGPTGPLPLLSPQQSPPLRSLHAVAHAAPAPRASLEPSDGAREYLERIRVTPPTVAPPAPLPQPAPPRGKPTPTPRPEAWFHFRIADGVELRVRDDRYYEAKGRLNAVVDALRATLQRYGLFGHDPPDASGERRD
jgi:DNA-binding transcriptional MerR regulator